MTSVQAIVTSLPGQSEGDILVVARHLHRAVRRPDVYVHVFERTDAREGLWAEVVRVLRERLASVLGHKEQVLEPKNATWRTTAWLDRDVGSATSGS